MWLKMDASRLVNELRDVPEDTDSRLAWINAQLHKN